MKDNFSKQAKEYAKFRPGYSDELVSYLSSLPAAKNLAWDCGTGNGQLALKLSEHFETVYATDISAEQLDRAEQRDNLIYIEEAAEQTDFDDDMFDLIVVAQAIHWFDFDAFYSEVNRCLQSNGVIAVLGYGLLRVNEKVNTVISKFYTDIVGSYWDKERRYIDEEYKTIPFPFAEIKTKRFVNSYDWNFDQLIGYLSTWSAVQHYMKAKNEDPIEIIKDELKAAWGDGTNTVHFDIFIRAGKKK
jgi:ubiquinone/menaquinone biosynthesis C-methylase UbiE